MAIVTAVSAARSAQPVPEYLDPTAFALMRHDWGRSAYASSLESASRPSRLAASGMTATETPLTMRDDGATKRRLQMMEEVAMRLARLAELNRSDLAARALESLQQKLRLLKMQALAAIMRGDRKVALLLADDMAGLVRAIVAAERELAEAGDASGGPVAAAIPVQAPQNPGKGATPSIAGEAAMESTIPPRMVLSSDDESDVEDVRLTARSVRDAAELHQLTAVLEKRSSPLLPLFDTSDGPDAVASEAATIIRALRRTAYRASSRHLRPDVGARIDASAVAASLGNIGLLGMAVASPA